MTGWAMNKCHLIVNRHPLREKWLWWSQLFAFSFAINRIFSSFGTVIWFRFLLIKYLRCCWFYRRYYHDSIVPSLGAVHEKIRIHVKAFGWMWCHYLGSTMEKIHCYQNWEKSLQKKRNWPFQAKHQSTIQNKRLCLLYECKLLKMHHCIRSLLQVKMNTGQMQMRSSRKRSKGGGGIFDELQPFYISKIWELINWRIIVNYSLAFCVDSHKESKMKWYQCKVIGVREIEKQLAVLDAVGNEECVVN